MKIIGLTGGIGSGKTTVTSFFAELGIPVYIADVEAKKLLSTSKVIRRQVIEILGEAAYVEGQPDRGFIASKVFNDTNLLSQLNTIIHPRVRIHFKKWAHKQKAPYVIKEAAILFENGAYQECDATILVTAPKDIRINRVMKRDGVAASQVEARMNHQWEDEIKKPLATFVIENIDINQTKKAVFNTHKKLLNLS